MQEQDKYDEMNPNELAIATLQASPYFGMRGRMDTLVPADLRMTKAECIAELRKAGKHGTTR